MLNSRYSIMEAPGKSAFRRAAYCLTLAAAAAPLVSITAGQALIGASLACLLLSRERLRLPPIKLPLLVFTAGTVLSLLFSGHIAEGWPQLRKFYVFLVLVPVATLLRKPADLSRLFLLWVAAATCSAAWGLVQFARRVSATNSLGAGLYQELVLDRITGLMSLWMTFGGQLVIVLMMLGAWLLFAPGGRRARLALAGCGAVMACALLLALTRGPWIAAAVCAVYLCWRWNRKSLLALPVIAMLAFAAAPATVRARLLSIVRPQSYLDSNAHRQMLWRTGFAMVRAHPWLGLGPEQVGKQMDRYIPGDFPRPLPWGWRGHLHNVYVQYAAERGIPVLLAFLWLVGRVLWDFRRALQKPAAGNRKAFLEGSVAALIGVLVGGFFEHNLGDSEVLQMFLTVIAAGYAAAPPGD